MKRVLTAVLLLPFFIAAVLATQPAYFYALVALAALLGTAEFCALAHDRCPGILKAFSCAWSLALLACAVWPETLSPREVLLAGMVALLLASPFMGKNLRRSALGAFAALFGAVYLGVLLGYLVTLRQLGPQVGPRLVFLLALAIWMGDSAAYYGGTLFGRHKLSPIVSPKKTWEGAAANVAGAVLGIGIAKFTFFPSLRPVDVLALGCLLSVVGQLGDFFESLLKRGAKVKDSSSILPGHGGVLDRIDSILFTGPVLFYYHQVFLR